MVNKSIREKIWWNLYTILYIQFYVYKIQNQDQNQKSDYFGWRSLWKHWGEKWMQDASRGWPLCIITQSLIAWVYTCVVIIIKGSLKLCAFAAYKCNRNSNKHTKSKALVRHRNHWFFLCHTVLTLLTTKAFWGFQLMVTGTWIFITLLFTVLWFS